MFGTVLTVASGVLVAFVAWRAHAVPFVARRLSPRWLVVLALVVWGVFALGRFVGHDGTGPLAAVLEAVGMLVLGAAFLHALPLLVVDVLTLFGRLLPRVAPALRGGALVAGSVLSVIALVQGHRAPEIVSQEVTVPGLPAALDGTVIVAVSDAHLGTQLGAAWMTDRVAQMRALHPDLVVFLGDMFEGHGDAPPAIPALRRLSAPLGKWFVDGNHESHREGGPSPAAAALERAGFLRLANASIEVAPGLVLAGTTDLTNHRRRGLPGNPLRAALEHRPAGATVLLSHTPWQAEQAAAAGVALMLSGHTHGGQIWPLGHLVRTVYPLVAGRHEVRGMTVIVSRGVGTWGPRMRLWRRGEIVNVTLRAASTRHRVAL